jgi:hypothetical protein
MKLASVARGRQGAVLVVTIVILFWVALALYYSSADEGGGGGALLILSGATFATAMTSFFGFMMLSRASRDQTGVFQDGDVRLAVACAFVTVYFELFALFIFAPEAQLGEFGKTLADNLLTQTALIIGFYFATTGALEYAKLRREPPAETKTTPQ